jgi:hypothetical protein
MPRVMCVAAACTFFSATLLGQLIDKNKSPNTSDEGITRPLIGAPYPSQIGQTARGTSSRAIRFARSGGAGSSFNASSPGATVRDRCSATVSEISMSIF